MSNIEREREIAFQKSHCPDCGHFRIRHRVGYGCTTCAGLIERGLQPEKTFCDAGFTSRLPKQVLEQAVRHSKDSYAGDAQCAVCFEIWWAHEGLLCPSGETLFTLLIGGDLIERGS